MVYWSLVYWTVGGIKWLELAPLRRWGSGPGGYLRGEPPGLEAAPGKAWLWSTRGRCGGIWRGWHPGEGGHGQVSMWRWWVGLFLWTRRSEGQRRGVTGSGSERRVNCGLAGVKVRMADGDLAHQMTLASASTLQTHTDSGESSQVLSRGAYRLTGNESESEVAQSCPTLCHPKDSSLHQALPSMGFSRQEYWSGLPFPSITLLSILWLCVRDLLLVRVEKNVSSWVVF